MAMQLELDWRDGDTLRSELEQHSGMKIRLTITDNSSSIMTFKSPEGAKPADLRIHRMFLTANAKVLRALATWLTKRRPHRSASVLDDFIRQNEHMIRQPERRNVRVKTRGRHFDLQAIYDELNREHFDGTVDTRITWGRVPGARKRRSIRFGSYTPEDNLIRIHPFLDRDFVPEFFTRYIVYHEMLHAFVGIGETPAGRRRIHSPEFKRLERAYPDYARSVAWHDNPKLLRRLLRTEPTLR